MLRATTIQWKPPNLALGLPRPVQQYCHTLRHAVLTNLTSLRNHPRFAHLYLYLPYYRSFLVDMFVSLLVSDTLTRGSPPTSSMPADRSPCVDRATVPFAFGAVETSMQGKSVAYRWAIPC
jgi:hypothetical protein